MQVNIYTHVKCGFRVKRLHTRDGNGTCRTKTEPVFMCTKCNYVWNMLTVVPGSDVDQISVNLNDIMTYEYGNETTRRKVIV